MHLLYLPFQLLGHGWALRFIFLEYLVSEGRGGAVEGDGPVSGFEIGEYFEQCAGKAIDGIYQFSGPGLGQRGQGMKSAMDQGIAVEKQQKRFVVSGHKPIILWLYRNPEHEETTQVTFAEPCEAKDAKIMWEIRHMAVAAEVAVARRGRYWEIDALRTVIIGMMVTFHALYILDWLGIRSTAIPGPYYSFWWWFGRVVIGGFTFLAGLSITITYSRGKKTSGFVLRGLQILGWGMLITLVTWVISPSEFVRFGVLHFFGITFMLAPFFLRFRYVNLILGVALMALESYVIQHGIYAPTPWLLWLWPYPMRSFDYWPLLSWFGLFLVAMFMGKMLYPQGKRLLDIPEFSNPVLSALTLPGRHPLAAYLAQWPVLVGVFLALFPSHVLPYFPPFPF